MAERLRHVLDDDGCLRVLALDHRDSLRVEFDREAPGSVPDQVLTDFKADVLSGFGDLPSGVMLEPEYSIPQLTERGVVAPAVGVICALEAQGYLADPLAGNRLLEGWSPAQAVAAGAAAAKVLVLYRPDRGEATERQERFVAEAAAACRAVDLPLFVEPVPFEVADPDDRVAVIAAAARRLGRLGPVGSIVLKAPFPGSPEQPEEAWADACAELDEACGPVPWATLSWGVDIETFTRQLAVACRQGCSGFMAGRALWRPALPPGNRAETISREVVPRFLRLVEMMAGATSVVDRLPSDTVSTSALPSKGTSP